MIYFVRAAGTDYIKIGYTADADSFKGRLQSLQTGQPWKLEVLRVVEDAGQWMESAFHVAFAEYRHHGEWFTYTPAMMVLALDSKAELRRHIRNGSRDGLAAMIARLIDLLDEWTPDVEAEPEADDEPAEDDEPDADDYVEIKGGGSRPARLDLFHDVDFEISSIREDEDQWEGVFCVE